MVSAHSSLAASSSVRKRLEESRRGKQVVLSCHYKQIKAGEGMILGAQREISAPKHTV